MILNNLCEIFIHPDFLYDFFLNKEYLKNLRNKKLEIVHPSVQSMDSRSLAYFRWYDCTSSGIERNEDTLADAARCELQCSSLVKKYPRRRACTRALPARQDKRFQMASFQAQGLFAHVCKMVLIVGIVPNYATFLQLIRRRCIPGARG